MSIEARARPVASRVFPVLACALAVLGLAWPIPAFWELYNLPTGSPCRPMGQTASVFLAGLGTPLLVLPFAITAISQRGSSRMVGLLAIAFSALPFPIYFLLLRWILEAHALSIKV